jgi:hypothetical protein
MVTSNKSLESGELKQKHVPHYQSYKSGKLELEKTSPTLLAGVGMISLGYVQMLSHSNFSF